MFILFFGILITSLHNGTRNYEECKKIEFKAGSCFESHQMEKSGNFLKKL